MIESAKHWVRAALYRAGLLGAVHRLRNRNTLTVFMFHRVLPKAHPGFERVEREFTFTTEGFGKCLDFVKRHYVPVDLAAVEAAASGRGKLPPCAALITFDDGWRDTLLHALPELQARNMPGVLFLATEVCSLEDDRWWQDWLVEALQLPDATRRLVYMLQIDQSAFSGRELVREVTARVSELSLDARRSLIKQFLPAGVPERQMLSVTDIPKLQPLLQVAGHGHRHGPLTHLVALADDLAACRDSLVSLQGHAETLSFPHGACNDQVIQAARQIGFKCLFSSEACLVSLEAGELRNDVIMGRIHIPENQWTCDGDSISYPKLATYLFFRKAT